MFHRPTCAGAHHVLLVVVGDPVRTYKHIVLLLGHLHVSARCMCLLPGCRVHRLFKPSAFGKREKISLHRCPTNHGFSRRPLAPLGPCTLRKTRLAALHLTPWVHHQDPSIIRKVSISCLSVPVMHVIEPRVFLVPNSSIYQPQQQVPYGGTSTQSAQPPSSHQTPPFPSPFVQGYPRTP